MAENSVFLLLGFCVGAMLLYAYMQYKHNEYIKQKAEEAKRMIVNWFKWERDGNDVPNIHPTQKPVKLLKRLIEIFTDADDVVIDPCAGSGSTLRACAETGRNAYGFEVDKHFYAEAKEKMLADMATPLF